MPSWKEFEESRHYPRYFRDYLYSEFDGDTEAASEWLWNAAASGEVTSDRALAVMSRYNAHMSAEGLAAFLRHLQRDPDDDGSSQFAVPAWIKDVSVLTEALHKSGVDMTQAAQVFEPVWEQQIWATLILWEIIDDEDLPEAARRALVRSLLAGYDHSAKYLTKGDIEAHARELATQYGVKVALDQVGLLGNPDELSDEEIAAVYADLAWRGETFEFIDHHIRPRGEAMLELLERDFHEHDGSYTWRATVGVVHALIAQDLGRDVDLLEDSLEACVRYRSLTSEEIRRYVVPVFEQLPQETIDKWIAATLVVPEYGRADHQVVATRLLDLLSEEQRRAAVGFWVPVIAEHNYPDEPTKFLSQCGPGLDDALADYVDDASAKELIVIANILGGHDDPESAQLLVELLGTKAKTPRAAAQKALTNFGASALEAVREGTESSKKAVREFCKAQLPRLEQAANAEGAEGAELDFDAEAMRRAFSYGEPGRKEFVAQHGVETLDLLADVLVAHDDNTALWEIVRSVDDSRKDTARKVIDVLCRMDLSKRRRNELDWRLKSAFGTAKAAAVMLERLENGTAMGLELEFTQFVLENRPLDSVELVLKGLQSDAKITRELAVAAAAAHRGAVGEVDEVLRVEDIVALLDDGRATTRKAATAALVEFADLDLAEYREAIEAALDNETDDKVAFELEELVDAL